MKTTVARNRVPELDIGKMVRNIMFQKGLNKARLARKMNRSGQTIKDVIFKTSVQTYLVWELSVALGHNFFADLAQQLDAATEGKLQQQQSELQQLKQDYERVKEERDYLKKAIDLLSAKRT